MRARSDATSAAKRSGARVGDSVRASRQGDAESVADETQTGTLVVARRTWMAIRLMWSLTTLASVSSRTVIALVLSRRGTASGDEPLPSRTRSPLRKRVPMKGLPEVLGSLPIGRVYRICWFERNLSLMMK